MSFSKVSTSLNNNVKIYTCDMENDKEKKVSDVLTILCSQKPDIISIIKKELEAKKAIKWFLAIKIELKKFINEVEMTASPVFHGKMRSLLKTDDIEEQFFNTVEKILESIAKYVRDGSGWSLKSITRLDIGITLYKPLYGSSYIETPTEISNSMLGIINVQNKDEKCFLWSVLAALHPVKKNKERVGKYKKYADELNMTDIPYPVKIEDIDQFEDLNPTISVNVFIFKNGNVFPRRITKFKGRRHINLLLLQNEDGNSHYCYISKLNSLFSKLTKHGGQSFYCNYCLHRFSSEILLKRHVPFCNPPAIVTLPTRVNRIETPESLAHPKKGILNIKCNDGKSFLWCVLAGIHKVEDRNKRISSEAYKPFETEIDMSGIYFPIEITSLDKFEKNNEDISVNVFLYEDNEVFPHRITKHRGRTHHINLLLLTNSDGDSHYCLIYDLSRLLSTLTKHNGESFYCNYCLHRFRNKETLISHEVLCSPHGAQKTKLPDEDEKWMYFKNYTLTHKTAYTVYADFESFAVPISTVSADPSTSSTTNTAKHVPSGFSYVIVDKEGKTIKQPVVYSGENVVDTFLACLMKEAKVLGPRLKAKKPMVMTKEQKKSHKAAKICHLCNKSLGAKKKVRNHDHITGAYLGAAHGSCNLNYQIPQHIPVFFHNLKGYDVHHLMEGIGKYKKEQIQCIASSSEKYISVSLGILRFLDSLQFMNTSLDTLVKNLAVDGEEKFSILKQCMYDNEENMSLLLRKGVFPYDYFTDRTKFTETSLPLKKDFYNKLTDSSVSEEDYLHAQNIWKAFKMNTFQDYHDLYLKTGVILLADVFENFRNMSMVYYNIDPSNCYSAPGLAWAAMLKMTNVKLELLTDIDQHLFIEKGIRGGVAMIPTRYAKANNSLTPNYDTTKPNSYITYFDCNNLYGTAMSEPLPQSDFRWLSPDEIDKLNFLEVSDNNETGYILEVDLEYPDQLHELHSDYPLAPERGVVNEEMLSPFSRQLQNTLGLKHGKTEKLLTTLNNKEKYIIHYRNLKLYSQLGLVIKKVYRALSFQQSPWLKKFISFNTLKRQLSNNKFEKDFFKLLNNSVYGKSLENVRGRVDFHLVNNEKKLIKLTASPRLKNFYIYNEDLTGVMMKRQTILLNKPIFVGFSVLDLSKLYMYDFHYNWAVSNYGTKVKLCMTDTDSLLYHIQTDNIYADMKRDLLLFDTSEYPSNHPCYSLKNKKALGKFKDELNSKPILEFIGLRAKCYSILTVEKHEKRVAKGVPHVANEKQLSHKLYKKCLKYNKPKITSASTIRSLNHNLYTQKLNKLSLSPFDDKRFVLQDGVQTLAYGHCRIKNLREDGEREEEEEEEEEEEGEVQPPPAKRLALSSPYSDLSTDADSDTE